MVSVGPGRKTLVFVSVVVLGMHTGSECSVKLILTCEDFPDEWDFYIRIRMGHIY